MRANPRGDWRIEDREAVARRWGLSVRRPSGSHVTFSHASIDVILTVPAHRPIKPIYVGRFVELIDEVLLLTAHSRADA